MVDVDELALVVVLLLVIVFLFIVLVLLVALGLALVHASAPVPILTRVTGTLGLLVVVPAIRPCMDQTTRERDANGQNEYCLDCLPH